MSVNCWRKLTHFTEHELPCPKSPVEQPCIGVLYAFVQEAENPLMGWKSARLTALTVERKRRRGGRRSEGGGKRMAMRWMLWVTQYEWWCSSFASDVVGSL